MCGIAGFWSPTLSAAERRETVRRMTYRLAHRGPDADGHWVPADTPIALGHRRLSVLTLGATFHGSSDTEVLLAAFEAWGIVQPRSARTRGR
jgi:asparagine synthetase B (glutamine-hydrolysing)